MRICLDARTVGKRMHGIARYNINLLHAIQNLHSPHTIYLIGQDPSYFQFLEQRKTRIHFLRLKVPPYSLLEQIVIPRVLARINPDAYHCLTYACPVLAPSHLFFTLHDLLPLTRPKEFPNLVKAYYRTFVRIASIRASRIIIDSYHTASRCSELLGTPPEKISVVPLGGDHLRHLSPSVNEKERFQGLGLHRSPYFMCVGNPRPHKRVLYLVKVFLSDPTLRDRNVQLVLVGEQHPEVYRFIRRYDHFSRIICTGYVSDALLAMLYTQALGLVCPSAEEGFGLPVIEAMYFGIPVVASEGSALSELLDGVGILLPQDEEESWAHAMCEVLLNPQKRMRHAMLAAEKALHYSWRRTAIATLRVYEETVRVTKA